MSDAGTGAGAVGSPAVHAGYTANDAAAVPMPAVPANTQRMSLKDFVKATREGTLPTHAPRQDQPQNGARGQQPANQNAQPQSAREHLAEKSRELEAKSASAPEPELGAEVDPNSDPEVEKVEAADAEVNEQTPDGSLSDAEIIARYREWEASDLAPEEIFANKLHPVKVRGQERFVDYNELRQGYMRGADYTRQGSELKAREQQLAAQAKSMQEHFEAIKDPNQMLEIYERNGYSDQLEKVAELVAQRRVEHRSLVRAAGRAAAERLGFSYEQIQAGQADNHREVVEAMQRTDARLKQTRQTEIENRKLSFERERFEREQQAARHAAEVAQHKETYDRQLNQLRPGAFKAHGIKDTAQSRTAFLRHLGEVIQLEGLGPDGITRAQVMSAARNLREENDDRMQHESGMSTYSAAEARARAQAEARRALGPNRTSTGAGKPLQAQQTAQRRSSDFDKMRRNGLLGK
jgi:hypothetical protein